MPLDSLIYLLLFPSARCDSRSLSSSSDQMLPQANKYLHHLAFTPTVWISLVEELWYRGIIDGIFPSDIHALSTPELIAVVKRLLLGPETWSPPRLDKCPRPQLNRIPNILRKLTSPISGARDEPAPVAFMDPLQVHTSARIVLHPKPIAMPGTKRDAQLLPGGNYVLFNNSQVLECWRVADDHLLCKYQSPSGRSVFDFSADFLDGGEAANIVMCTLTPHSEPSIVEIVRLDLVNGNMELVSTTACPEAYFESEPSTKICGGIVAVGMIHRRLWAETYMIIDWRTQRYCSIKAPVGSKFLMELVPGHLIFTLTSPSYATQEICVSPIASLPNFWSSGDHHTTDLIPVSDVPVVASHTIKPRNALISRLRRYRIELVAHESPLQRGTYRVWLYIPYICPRILENPVERALLYSFRLSLPGAFGRELTWRERSCAPGQPDTCYRGISYSGHTQALGNFGQQIFPPETYPAPILVDGPQGPWWNWAHLAPYSGALTYLTGKTLVVRYFK
ncbi:hypothetical protein DFH09DRAFT_1165426 [Mycena vulgaris]|nr:hypothetical protein DFH09DRAFT_1165426 [Mycena vulgaris]